MVTVTTGSTHQRSSRSVGLSGPPRGPPDGDRRRGVLSTVVVTQTSSVPGRAAVAGHHSSPAASARRHCAGASPGRTTRRYGCTGNVKDINEHEDSEP